METNRYEEYWETFNWTANENVALININNEFYSDGKVKAFEAYITRKGCIEFMVSNYDSIIPTLSDLIIPSSPFISNNHIVSFFVFFYGSHT